MRGEIVCKLYRTQLTIDFNTSATYPSFYDKFVIDLTVLAVALQVQKAPLLVGAAFLTVILASVIPIIRNADLNISGAGPFNQRAEVRMIVQYSVLHDML